MIPNEGRHRHSEVLNSGFGELIPGFESIFASRNGMLRSPMCRHGADLRAGFAAIEAVSLRENPGGMGSCDSVAAI
jgi:hypothetical protein